ncbi:hypothetical protein M5689_005308 [Euphorbia peplus]|nr:hypothetical protein M5689_005308 [Euphorbia peplus]
MASCHIFLTVGSDTLFVCLHVATTYLEYVEKLHLQCSSASLSYGALYYLAAMQLCLTTYTVSRPSSLRQLNTAIHWPFYLFSSISPILVLVKELVGMLSNGLCFRSVSVYVLGCLAEPTGVIIIFLHRHQQRRRIWI